MCLLATSMFQVNSNHISHCLKKEKKEEGRKSKVICSGWLLKYINQQLSLAFQKKGRVYKMLKDDKGSWKCNES